MNIGPGTKLQVVLGSSPANQPRCYAAWIEAGRGGDNEVPYSEAQRYNVAQTNNTTDVDLIGSVPEDRVARVQMLNVFNTHSSALAVYLKLDESGTETILWAGAISADKGISIIDQNPDIADAQLSGQIVLTDADKLEVVLSSPHSTTAPRVYASWSETRREDGPHRAERHQARRRHTTIVTNATTPVELVGAPGSSDRIRRIDAILMHNNDTATATLSIRINRGGTLFALQRFSLAPGENASFFASSGWSLPEGSGSGAGSSTVVSETSFGQASSAGTSSNFSRADHTHGTPTNPVPAHEAAGDPHPGYQLESEKGAANGYASLSAAVIVPASQLATSGTADGTTFLRGDRVWATPPGGGGGGSTDDAIWAHLMGVF